jgi:hypothetical protein
MKDEEILQEIKKYFCIEEFVSKEVFEKYGESAWQFISPRLLHTMLIIRKEFKKSITINNWKWGGKFSQRGLRENTCRMVMNKNRLGITYLSAHVLGCAVDFDIQGVDAMDVRIWLAGNPDKLPYKIRLENEMNGKQINWVHLDVYSNEKNPKVYLFNV